MLTTLAVQTEWPTPARARPAPALEISPNVTLLLGLPTPQQIKAVEQPNPVRARATPQDFIWIGATTRGIPRPPPVRPLEWPVPRRPRLASQDFIWAGGTTRGIPAPPFWSADGWSGWSADGWPLWSADGFIGAQPLPFSPTEWPTPTRARATPPAIDYSENWLTTNLLVSPPFALRDLPAPARSRAVSAQDQPPNLLTAQLAATALPPGAALLDTPMLRARVARFDDPPNVAVNAPIAATLPFRQSEQPLAPLRAKATPYAEIAPNTTALGIPSIRLPFGLNDWPQVSRARGLIHEAGSGRSFPPTAQIPPFAFFDWPTPARRQYAAAIIQPDPNAILFRTTLTFWSADGWPGWSADGWPVWSADGFIGPAVILSRNEFKAARDKVKFIAENDVREFIAARDRKKFTPL